MFGHRQVIQDEPIYPRRVSHFAHVRIIFQKKALFNPKCWSNHFAKPKINDPENDIEWLKETFCSCENNDLEKDVERGESWGYNGFSLPLNDWKSDFAHVKIMI